ncbi:Nucleosome assembly protein [Entamoeba marina]
MASELVELCSNGYEDYMSNVDEQVHKNYHACRTNFKEIQTLRLIMEKEKHEALLKYTAAAQQILDRRDEIISGTSEPTTEELSGYEKSTEIEPSTDSEFKKGIPAFWLAVLKNSIICEASNANDADMLILVHLKTIKIEHFPAVDCVLRDGTPSLLFTYKLHFVFEQNEYFSNDVITVKVECKMGEVAGEFEEPVITTEAPIQWHKDKDPRYKLVKRRGGKRGGRARQTAAVRQKVDSFFDLFYTPALPADLNLDEMDEIDEDVIVCHTNFKIFMELINEIIPVALSYFDETMADEDDEDDEDFDDIDDMCDSCEGDDLDDDDEADDDNKMQAPVLDNPPAPQECPQQ